MAQSDDEIKMNSTESSPGGKKHKLQARSISRDFVPREFAEEPKLSIELAPAEATTATRRDFFRGFLPSAGKLLTTFVRTVGVTVSAAVEGKK
jgi:hypothetical protein